MKRREFFAFGLPVLAGSATSCSLNSSGVGWRFFTEREALVMEAACAQLIPEDRDPGAKQAGVVNYIDLQLATRFRKHRAAYRKEIAALDTASRGKYGKGFVEVAPEQQVELLNGLEENSGAFFDLLLAHARQGFYGDPRHGGNRHMASWKLLGLPYPQVRGRQNYEQKKVG
jgi:gluconate 2-dehydrogenase gamma chain